MAITFTYTESTNIVVVTEGTSGAPATFANFVTFDRAGTDTVLLSAGAPASNLALTYAVRPVEDLAILVKCVVANKTAEADFIFITGTDWRGAAQTESIDVTAGNGSYTSAKYWATITTLDCSDNANGGGTVWADGDLTVTQDVWGVIWDFGNVQYQADCKFDIGNGSTSTYFQSDNEFFKLPAHTMRVRANAYLTIGAASNIYSKDGSGWLVYNIYADSRWFVDGGDFQMYGSLLTLTGDQMRFSNDSSSDIKIYNSIINANGINMQIRNANTIYMKDVYISECDYLRLDVSPDEFTDVHFEAAENALRPYSAGALTVQNIKITNYNTYDYEVLSTSYLTLLDPITSVANPNTDATSWIKEAYTCNIHVSDKDGTNLAGVSVACEDTNADAAFTTQTTAADGTITEQNITYKKWEGVDETLTTYSPHKFTVSKAGYETLVLDAITVDAPIIWHLELQPAPGRVGTLVATELDKDTSGQKVSIYAFDSGDGNGKTGDAANITAQISIDGGATVATNDTNPTELDAIDAPGIYIFDLTQAETNGDMIVISVASSTSNIKINPIMIRTKSYIERLSQRHHGI